MDLSTAKKAIVAFLVVLAGALGIEFANLDWWIWLLEAVVTGLAVYWTKNSPGTLTRPARERPDYPR